MSTREHFIDVGLKLMQEKGYEATGPQEILAEAGLPKGSFYHHFGSKEEFGREVIARYAAQEAARCARYQNRRGPLLPDCGATSKS